MHTHQVVWVKVLERFGDGVNEEPRELKGGMGLDLSPDQAKSLELRLLYRLCS